jgi:hypothetical protein
VTESAAVGPAETAPPSRGRQAFQWLSLFAILAIPIAAIVWLVAADNSCACTSPAVPSPLVGVVVAVDSAGLGQVRGFTLRTSDGTYGLTLGPLENATEFSPSHLTEHMLSSEPVRAYVRTEGNEAIVYRLEDASLASSPAAT